MNRLHPESKIFKEAHVTNSYIARDASVGDYSKVKKSMLSQGVRIDRNNYLDGVGLGQFSYTGKNTLLIRSNIGAFCSISWNVSVGGADHDYTRTTQHSFLYDRSIGLMPPDSILEYDRYDREVTIGNDVWIAAGVVVTRGVTIGNGAVIGANSVVTTDIPPYAVAVGVPAKVIKYRFMPEVIDKMLMLKWWSWTPEKIRANYGRLSQKPTLHDLEDIINNDSI